MADEEKPDAAEVASRDLPLGSASLGERVKAYASKNWLPLFSAFVLGLGFPLWKMFIYEAADISVEVTEVERKSDTIRIEVFRDPAFKPLFEGRRISFDFPDFDPSSASSGTMTLPQLERYLESKKDFFDREDARIADQRRRVEEIRSTPRFDLTFANRLNGPLSPEIEFDPSIFRDAKANEIEQLRSKFFARYQQDTETREKNQADSRKAFDGARAAFAQRQEQANLKLARISLKGAISNSGAGAISLRPQGFLRVYLGGNNYVDIELNMEQYDSKGDMQPRSSKIVSYRSDAIGTLRDTDQDKINTYFKQNVPAALFIVDINGKVYQSNTIPFAQGLYQQSVFDMLRSAASKRRPPEVKQ